tara:strand:+ start:163 stop:645 length:483 start_codon:yes stop_codon:yes gene_type:complete
MTGFFKTIAKIFNFFLILVVSYLTPDQNFSLEKKKFFSTKYSEANLRNGPGTNHLILYKILHKGYPVLIMEEFENWKRITDYKNRSGWIANSQLSSSSYGIIIENNSVLFKFPTAQSKQTALLQKDVIFEIATCKPAWCKIKINDLTGWIETKRFWGSKH